MQMYGRKTVIITPMNLALVSSLEFTKRANSQLGSVLKKKNKKKLFKHSERRAVCLVRLLNKGAMI